MAGGGEAPPFWWQEPDWRSMLLWPPAWGYGRVAAWRMRNAPRERLDVPVLCVGNLSVGGEGKTPVAIALARAAEAQGLKPGFLSRGHGGSHSRPRLVSPDNDVADVVGDEPLLLARHAPTAVTPDRAAGARRLIEEGCDFLVMDDGFQSARIHFDYALIVVDARRGLGNGHVIPAGPLRAPLTEQVRHATAFVRIGEGDAAEAAMRAAARAARPIMQAWLKPLEPQAFEGLRVLAFAGIGNPDKFFATLREAGAELVDTRAFPDHHAFSRDDLDDLSARADAQDLALVTTAKDAVRLETGMAEMRAFRRKVAVLEVEARFEEQSAAVGIIRRTLAAAKERMHEKVDD